MKTLGFPSLLIVDEIGYLPISRTGAMLFFCVIAFPAPRRSIEEPTGWLTILVLAALLRSWSWTCRWSALDVYRLT